MTDKIDIGLPVRPDDLPRQPGRARNRLPSAEPGPTITALPLAKVDKTTIGIHFGVDVSYMITPRFGVGGIARYSVGIGRPHRCRCRPNRRRLPDRRRGARPVLRPECRAMWDGPSGPVQAGSEDPVYANKCTFRSNPHRPPATTPLCILALGAALRLYHVDRPVPRRARVAAARYRGHGPQLLRGPVLPARSQGRLGRPEWIPRSRVPAGAGRHRRPVSAVRVARDRSAGCS